MDSSDDYSSYEEGSLGTLSSSDSSDSDQGGGAARPGRRTAAAAALSVHNSVVKKFCTTDIRVYKFSFTWTIKNFSFCKARTGEKLESSTFKTGPKNDAEWLLQVYPKGKDKYHKDLLSVYVVLVSCNKFAVQAKIKFSLQNTTSRKTKVRKHDTPCRITTGTPCGFSSFIENDWLLDKSSGFLPNDNLTIVCEGTVSEDEVEVSGFSGEPQEDTSDGRLPTDLGSLFRSGEFGDVTLLVGTREMLVHKAILAVRSPVFAAMFKHQMEESQRNRVIITDVDYDILEKMLTYIYTGRLQNIKEIARELLVAADKYDVGDLKAKCEEVLCSTLTIENAEDLLIFADKHSAKRLKVRCVYFISTREAVMFKPA